MARGSTRRRRRIRACLPGALLAVAVLLPGSGGALVTVFPSYSPWFALGTDVAPSALEIADLNGDAKPDIATANLLGDNVSVFLNAGYGSFLRRDYVTSARPSSLAIADLDGDGKPDLVTGSEGDGAGGMVSVLVNSGEGSFGAQARLPDGGDSVLGRSRRPGRRPCAGPRRRDGRQRRQRRRRDRGSGERRRRRLREPGMSIPSAPIPGSVAIGDLNADGSADLATANTYAGTISVLLNDGHGRFPARRDYATGNWAPSVAIGDLNADGKADLVAGQFDRFVSVFFNRGDGTFGVPREHQTGRYSNDVAIADLNGDGAPGSGDRELPVEHGLRPRKLGRRELRRQA